MAIEEGSRLHREGAETDLVRTLVRDLADLMQAQATVTKDLARLIDLLSVSAADRAAAGGVADSRTQATGGARVAEAAPRVPEARRPEPPDPAPPTPPAPLTPLAPPATRPPARRAETPPPASAPPIEAEEETEFTVVTPGEGISSAAATGPGEELDESEPGDEVDRPEIGDATVLLLESGKARVGVLWSQVAQVGSLGTPVAPPRIDSERGTTDLVSLGLLLHGVSREEKYFVVLEQDGERAAVACERMLGLGPLSSAAHDSGDQRIQVLGIPLLRTFGKGAQAGGAGRPAGARAMAGGRDEDERDRSGPLRALVAVRYLPARVAICRHLRGRGWQVGEAAGLEAATVSLDLGHWDAIFLEASGNGEVEEIEGNLMRRVEARRIPVIRVGSRITGLPQQEGPAVMFPFAEAELDTILTQLAERPATG